MQHGWRQRFAEGVPESRESPPHIWPYASMPHRGGMHVLADRQIVLAIAAKANVDPRTVRRRMRGEHVVPALALAIDAAREAIEQERPPKGGN